MKINTVDSIIQDFREGQNIFRRPSVELMVREISRLQARVQELEQGLKNKCANCGLAIPHGIWGDEDNDYDNLPKLPQDEE